MGIATINPYTDKATRTFDQSTPGAIEAAIAGADSCFQEWKATSYIYRAALLRKVAALLLESKDELARLITSEMGKRISESFGEIELSSAIFTYYADHAEEFLADVPIATEKGEAFIRSSPVGVLLGIEPWNFPFYQVARFAAPNIMVGNTILLKHASNVPQCALAIQRIFHEAGAPHGLYTNLFIPGAQVARLLDDPRIKGASLTGGEEAGASLAAAAGKNLKKSVLELGGSDAFIVLEDADIDMAVHWGFIGRMNNTGQCCVASKRFIVLESVADEFTKKLIAQMSDLIVGDPMDARTQLGPLSSEQAAVHLVEQVKNAVSDGASVLLGGSRIEREGAFYEATILEGIKPGSPSSYQELFGPVAVIYRVPDEEAAISLANDSPFGLGGSVFSADIERAKRVADRIDTGMVFINHPTWTAPNLPFGGVKRSGYGRELSRLGIAEFVNKKLIRVSELGDPF